MSQGDPSINLDGVIARSRSRYRGNRPNQTVTSANAPPTIPPELLEQQKDRPRGLQETRGVDADTKAKEMAVPSKVHVGGVTGDSYINSIQSTSRHPTVVPPVLSNQRARTFPVERPSPDQGVQHDHERQGDAASKAPNGAREDGLRGHVASQELRAERKIHQQDYVKSVEAFNRTGNKQIERVHAQRNVQLVTSPPIPSKSNYGESRPSDPKSAQVSHKPSTLQKRSLTHRRKESNVRDELKRSISAPMPVELPEVTTKPAFDAPVSAVNAGERRVRVQLDQTPLSIAVTPSTTPLDVLREAGSQLSLQLDATTNVLMECFKALGLERPLRRYERIRDVMNSWDNDAQNSLSIIPSTTGGRDSDLDLSSVASAQPGDTSVHIYHSNSPGSWDKRWITLRSDGQVLMSKKDDGKEGLNICHVSDFDIYVPTRRQMAKKIKPPKKYCFAVKSQQKSAMFLTTENFVHFFAAGDRELAMAWYKAVQEWRSWYLVNVMGEGNRDTNTSSIPQQVFNGYQPHVNQVKGVSSIDHAYRQQAAGSERTQQTAQDPKPKRLPTNNQVTLPVSLPKKLTKGATSGAPTTRRNAHPRASIIKHQPLLNTEPEPFAAQGLLGRSYTQRQKAVGRGSNEEVLEYGSSAHAVGNVSAQGSNRLQQTATQRPQQQPLLDITAKRLEPPQHRQKGIGFTPEHFPGGGLIEAAKNGDPTVTSDIQKREATIRNPSIDHVQHPADTEPTASPEKHGPAFTGGLLSSAQKHGQDGTGSGHGVKTGDREAKEPLLDMTMEGPWAKGSLLDRVNSGGSESGPPIDREKRQEMNAPVGEGM